MSRTRQFNFGHSLGGLRRPVVARALTLVFLVALNAGGASKATAEPLSLMLDWFLNPDHATLVIAEQKGYFAEAGLEVAMSEPADPTLPPKLVAAGQVDLAVSYQPQLHLHVAEGLPLVRVATLVATPLNTLLVLDDGPITKIADLAGRKVGYSVGGFEDALLGTMLAKHGVALADVELINVNFALSPALLSGQVDAVIGAYRNFELNQLAIEGHQGRAFFVEEHGVPAYDELIIVAQRNAIDQPRLGRFVDALERAAHFLVNHPDESWDLFVAYRDSINDELNRRAWRDTLPRFALRPGSLDQNRYQRFAAFLAEQGLIEAPAPLPDYAIELPR